MVAEARRAPAILSEWQTIVAARRCASREETRGPGTVGAGNTGRGSASRAQIGWQRFGRVSAAVNFLEG